MKTIADEWMVFRMENPAQDGVCKVEIIQLGDGRHAVILEELDDNPGQSVSQAWEAVVATVEERYHVPRADAVWIEHDPIAESAGLGEWQVVTFSPPEQVGEIGKANWRTMTADDWHELGLPVR